MPINARTLAHRADMESGTITAIVGGLAAAVVAFFTGRWQWKSDSRKSDVDAQKLVFGTLMELLAEFKGDRVAFREERTLLIARIDHLEGRVAMFERIMREHKIEIIEGKAP